MPRLDSSTSYSDTFGWNFSIAIPYRPPVKTVKVLNLRNEQWPGLREETKVCGLLYGLIFHSL